MSGKKWEIVHSAAGLTQANIIVGRLKVEGIPTKMRYEAVGAIYAITIDGLGQVDILVPAVCLEHAREILSRSYDESDMDWEGA